MDNMPALDSWCRQLMHWFGLLSRRRLWNVSGTPVGLQFSEINALLAREALTRQHSNDSFQLIVGLDEWFLTYAKKKDDAQKRADKAKSS